MNWCLGYSFLSLACFGMMMFAVFAKPQPNRTKEEHNEAATKVFMWFLWPFLLFGFMAGINFRWPS